MKGKKSIYLLSKLPLRKLSQPISKSEGLSKNLLQRLRHFSERLQGFRIELSEIEHVAKNFFNGECRVVVIPKYDNDNQCELHLVVEKKQLDKQQMEEYLYSRLPYYMIPKHMHCLEQFPLNTSSKTDRKKIQELI